jgi:hypothetical protein
VADRVALTIPRERPFHRVAHLVLGGLALRHNLTLEQLEDLQIALDALLEHSDRIDEITVELELEAQRIEASIGPFETAHLRAALERDPGDGEVGLSRVLSTVVDWVELVERGDQTWVQLTKTVQGPTEAA